MLGSAIVGTGRRSSAADSFSRFCLPKHPALPRPTWLQFHPESSRGMTPSSRRLCRARNMLDVSRPSSSSRCPTLARRVISLTLPARQCLCSSWQEPSKELLVSLFVCTGNPRSLSEPIQLTHSTTQPPPELPVSFSPSSRNPAHCAALASDRRPLLA